MNPAVASLRRRAAMFCGIALAAVAYLFARLPGPSEAEQAASAARFHFARLAMPEAPHGPYHYIRQVHPSLRGIDAWMSSLGAAVALADLDADGLSNDLCRVEPRTDQVIVAPVPGTGDRYRPFALEPSGLPYDPATTAPMGCLAADLNEDGLMDLVVYFWGRTPIGYLRKSGTPGVQTALQASDFTPVDLIPTGERWYTNAAFLADLDGDGHLDLVIGNYFKDGARTLDAAGAGTESMHDTKSKAFNGGSKHVLRWRSAEPAPHAAVRFEEIANVFDERVTHGWALAGGAADLDGDLLPEIYFAHDFGPDRLLHNLSTPGHLKFAVLEGRRDMATPPSLVLGHDSFKGMSVDFADVNGDGRLDIYVSNIADRYALQESHFVWLSTGNLGLMRQGIAPYVQGAERLGLSRSGWGWDARFDDFDNDGVLEAVQATGFVKGKTNRWPELQALGTGNDKLMQDPHNWPAFKAGDDISGGDCDAFFVRGSDGRYFDIGRAIGFSEPMVSRGIAIADVDGDGRLDFALANQWEDSYFFHNQSPATGAFLGLHLLLPLHPEATRERAGHPSADTPGRPAIGATASALLPDGRKLVAQVDGGSGHSGKRAPEIHFGLGKLAPDALVAVSLAWRDPRGAPHRQEMRLAPGWHTVLLGWPEGVQ
jgi:enediyne biosynthesis protein E4